MSYKQETKGWVDKAKELAKKSLLIWFWFCVIGVACGFIGKNFKIETEDLITTLIRGSSAVYIAATIHRLADKTDDND